MYENGARNLPGHVVAQERAALLDPRECVEGRDTLDKFDKIRLVCILYRNLSAEDTEKELKALSVLSENQTNPQAQVTLETLLDRAWGLAPVSSLSCQAIVKDSDLTIEIPKYSINQVKEGH